MFGRPGGRELDRQGQPVEASGDLRDRRGVVVGKPELRLHRGQLRHPDPVREPLAAGERDLDRQPALVHPARAGQGDQPCTPELRVGVLELALPADQGAELHRQIR
jgi:hypothetical protein